MRKIQKADTHGSQRSGKCGKFGKVFVVLAGVLTALSLFTCIPMIYPAFIFILLFIIPVVCTLGLIFVISDGYWDWISGILSDGMAAVEIMLKVWIWPEIAGFLFCIVALALLSRDKTKRHTGGIILCILLAIACVLFAVVHLISTK